MARCKITIRSVTVWAGGRHWIWAARCRCLDGKAQVIPTNRDWHVIVAWAIDHLRERARS